MSTSESQRRFDGYADTIALIFIGNHFYHDSGTMMSSIYTEEGYRFDWGFVDIALQEGHRITIRPARADELAAFERELTKYRKPVTK